MHVRTIAAAAAVTLGAMAAPAYAFNPQPEPPGFGIVSVNPDQTIRLNVVCWEHDVAGLPPTPCSGELMFHDMAGNIVARQIVRLRPGGATVLDYSPGPRTSPATLVGIDPCWIPDPLSGRALPTVEVFDTASGRVARHVNPLTPRITFIDGDLRAR
jgi:hypothetical protein